MIFPFNQDSISVYIHWPFCYVKCGYCDFNSYSLSSSTSLHPNDYNFWKVAYLNSINKHNSFIKNKKIKSIFFGGGTPSLMPVELVKDIIDYFAKHNLTYFKNSNIEEITLESNPSSFEVNKFKDFKDAGINRLSTGVQSFNSKNLKFLGRNHNVTEAKFALEESNKIFPRTSFDLIMGLPLQSLKDWQEDLHTAMYFFKEHLSLYQLTIEEGTVFFKKNIGTASEDVSAEMFEYTINFLLKNNIYQYEISNFAVSNKASIHNLNYWLGGEYIGIGPGAHSRVFVNNNWYSMVEHKNPKQWYMLASSNQSNFVVNEQLSFKERLQEILLTSLRVDTAVLPIIESYINKNTFNTLQELGLLQKDNNKYLVTKKGKMVLNYVIKELNDGLLI